MIDQDLVDELAKHFRQGATVKIAAGRIGVPPGVLRSWLRIGEEQLADIYAADVGYPEQEGLLYFECAKATAEYLAEHVGTVSDPTDAPDWRASSWLLERRDEDFNPASRVEVSGPEAGPIQIEGKTLVGIADIVALYRATGQGHLLGLGEGDAQEALPSATDVLPDHREPVGAADRAAPVPGS
jgi:hypothetical protein